MATTKKITRKELLKPDEFFSLWGRVYQFIQENKQPILLSGAGIIALILLISGSIAYSKNKEIKASDLLSEVQLIFNTTSSPATMPEQKAPSLISTPEKKEQALEILEKITDKYDSTHAALIARIIQGQIYYENKEYDKAQTVYENFIKESHDEEELIAQAREGLSYCHEARGEFDKAVKSYEKMSQSPLPSAAGWALIGKARCHEKLEDMEMAIADYKKFISEYPQHPKINEAIANMARLQGKATGSQDDDKSINSDKIE